MNSQFPGEIKNTLLYDLLDCYKKSKEKKLLQEVTRLPSQYLPEDGEIAVFCAGYNTLIF